MGFQKIIIAGNIGKLNDLKYTPTGKAVCTFSVAVTENFDKGHTEWFQCEVWDKTAEAVAKYLNVGSYVVVEGRLKTRKWEDKDGQTRYSVELKAARVEFGPSLGQGGGRGPTPAPTCDRAPQRQQEPQGGRFNLDDDIPF